VFNLHDIFQERSPDIKQDLPVYVRGCTCWYSMVYTALFWNLSCFLLKPVSYMPVNLGREPNRIMLQNGGVHGMGELQMYSCLLFS